MVLWVLTSLGPWGLPQMVQKFYALKNEKIVYTATILATIFCFDLPLLVPIYLVLTHLFFDQLPQINGEPNPELFNTHLIAEVMHPAFP